MMTYNLPQIAILAEVEASDTPILTAIHMRTNCRYWLMLASHYLATSQKLDPSVSWPYQDPEAVITRMQAEIACLDEYLSERLGKRA